MCGGTFGKIQNIENSSKLGFGLIGEKTPVGKVVQFERDAQDWVSSSDDHQTETTKKERAERDAARSVANTEAAQAGAEAAEQSASKSEEEFDSAMTTRAQKTLLTIAKEQEEKQKSQQAKTTNKSTLLGG